MCRNEANRIKANLNPAINPCDDFFEYSCGGYAKTHALPDDKGVSGTFDVVDENVISRLDAIFTGASPTGDIKPLQFVRNLYQSCNNTGESRD